MLQRILLNRKAKTWRLDILLSVIDKSDINLYLILILYLLHHEVRCNSVSRISFLFSRNHVTNSTLPGLVYQKLFWSIKSLYNDFDIVLLKKMQKNCTVNSTALLCKIMFLPFLDLGIFEEKIEIIWMLICDSFHKPDWTLAN